jgi:hypothetical protein
MAGRVRKLSGRKKERNQQMALRSREKGASGMHPSLQSAASNSVRAAVLEIFDCFPIPAGLTALLPQ